MGNHYFAGGISLFRWRDIIISLEGYHYFAGGAFKFAGDNYFATWNDLLFRARD